MVYNNKQTLRGAMDEVVTYAKTYGLRVELTITLDHLGVLLEGVTLSGEVSQEQDVSYIQYYQFKQLPDMSCIGNYAISINIPEDDEMYNIVLDDVVYTDKKTGQRYLYTKDVVKSSAQLTDIELQQDSLTYYITYKSDGTVGIETSIPYNDTAFYKSSTYTTMVNSLFKELGSNYKEEHLEGTDFKLDDFKGQLRQTIRELKNSMDSSIRGSIGSLHSNNLPKELYKDSLHLFFKWDGTYTKNHQAYFNAIVEGYHLNWNVVTSEQLKGVTTPLHYTMNDFGFNGRGSLDSYQKQHSSHTTGLGVRSVFNDVSGEFVHNLKSFYQTYFKTIPILYRELVKKETIVIDLNVSTYISRPTQVYNVDNGIYILDDFNQVVLFIKYDPNYQIKDPVSQLTQYQVELLEMAQELYDDLIN